MGIRSTKARSHYSLWILTSTVRVEDLNILFGEKSHGHSANATEPYQT